MATVQTGKNANTTNPELPHNVSAEQFARAKAIESKVRDFVKANERGCQGGHLIYVEGFSKKEIDLAVFLNLIEAKRGREAGYFPFGEVPEAQEITPSLKARMVEVLNQVVKGKTPDKALVKEILKDYESEQDMRKEVLEKARAARSENAGNQTSH